MDVTTAIKTRRSIRYFTDKIPDKKTILDILDVARYAPSSCNLQRWHFTVISDSRLKKRLVTEAKGGPHINHAPIAIVVSTDSRYSQELHADIQSVSAAVQNISLKAHDEGLGTLWMAGIGDTQIIKKIINMPKHYNVHAILLLGYPTIQPEIPYKRPLNQIISFNTFKEFYIPSTLNLSEWDDSQINEFKTTYLRARSGFSWRKLNPQQDELLNIVVNKFKLNNYLDIYPYPGRHLYDASSRYKLSYSILQPKKSTAKYLVEEVAGDKTIYVEDEEVPLRKYDLALLFETYEGTKDKASFIRHFKKYLKKRATVYLIYRNNYLIQKLYWFFTDKFTLLHRYFGPVKLESFSNIKKEFEKQGFKVTFLYGCGLTPFDKKVSKGLLGKFMKQGLVRLELNK